MFNNKPLFRVGIGYDVHQLINTDNKEQFITICGIKIPHNKKIKAHSDGDLGIHALTDAILGCVGCGSIGQHFPDTDLKFHKIDSSIFLLEAQKKAKEKGYTISNIDIIIICQQPKIMPYSLQMQQYLTDLLQLDFNMVNIKAVTTEKLGFIGKEQGIAAQAIVGCSLII
ncbi:2-C-methyl-D-erythritol 2,4-cyclodiphosphate synthase [Neoehrlichia mikurensis]|uniref:2-C-methyl-D-erythritol 2,4-cyclodiphosphate synthase n=1 Tax=Neoehrlichia mikurensis TaxID=89586 RepID=A0A9Q9C0P5_9RICK|nr:2-C-methyl-D-erythritol 2,4-cyclodiphosphate synthase [Neoehrlichia mikurensis]QXK92246.1 2-C-methyl-D-erythritol 2,4-cyclodiphosphate synthase [Neoehrlichia mikurensis]QXK92701.1 2-C-methyl-D-erythritol 2,4-cyclodiphosphate synthase [Neoehrlichia mikurensis]QXK93939.1 2-C-methyl-D-erythritol 2,4-cyclodiphosphate synthase [Neoehrlichia mikurensis]UTO55899.1 2-C-methyl-D-erythritol 2,4-cyclodiphosphate synthase [Neoehrlichia mikurensis]UTO56815.1 2-C-methyl-D-erythritol 2,4-cyclodiphosphate 